jgi:hypothetical protein
MGTKSFIFIGVYRLRRIRLKPTRNPHRQPRLHKRFQYRYAKDRRFVRRAYSVPYPFRRSLVQQHIPKTELKLYKFSLADGSYEVVSNAIPFLSEEIYSRVYLFHDDFTREFYAVVREFVQHTSAEIRIYSLSSPPVNESALKSYMQTDHFPQKAIRLAIVVVAIILARTLNYKNQKKTYRNRRNNG